MLSLDGYKRWLEAEAGPANDKKSSNAMPTAMAKSLATKVRKPVRGWSAIWNPIHMSETSAFRPCGHDLTKVFKSTA